MEQLSTSLGRTVEEAIDDAGLSKRHVSEATGIPLTTLLRKLAGRGKSTFTAIELYDIAKVLKGRLIDLLPREWLS